MKRFAGCAMLVGCLSGLWTAQVVHAATITMAFFEAPEKEPLFKYAELLYTEAFRRLGFGFVYEVYPLKRCSAMADAGAVDGEPGRIRDYNQMYPNLIRVEEPVLTTVYLAFSTNAAMHLNGWDSLQDTTYRVDYRIGES